jgi:hypothetical protein
MLLTEFVAQINGFNALQQPQKIKLFAWYLHNEKKVEHFTAEMIRQCYKDIHEVPPDLSIYLPRLWKKKPPEIIKDSKGLRLSGVVRSTLDAKYGDHPTTAVVKKLLAELPAKIPNIAERVFLQEALDCYKVKAYRAAIVMAWNLAYDHLSTWILTDASRLAKFNADAARVFTKKPKAPVVASATEPFAEYKESELVQIAKSAVLITDGMSKILKKELDRRNSAAHPSSVVMIQSQADDAITDLVNNVVLALK